MNVAPSVTSIRASRYSVTDEASERHKLETIGRKILDAEDREARIKAP